jgi:hypothetical protein
MSSYLTLVTLFTEKEKSELLVTLETLKVSLNQEIEKRIKAESEIQVTTILRFFPLKLQKLNDRSSTIY